MVKINNPILQLTGGVGALICLGLFIHAPSFPTPDKLFIFLFFVFLALDQVTEYFYRLGPFIAIILTYESFRSVADKLNNHVHYLFAPHFDQALFGQLPTLTLQHWLWRGHVQWYDIVLYIPYMLFFVVPFLLAILVWKTRVEVYWRLVTTFAVLFFAAFLTFLLIPTAPPWMASQNHQIEPITRISSYVWAALGIHDFPSVYNHLAPNPVAAFPSLHSAVSTLSSIVIFKLYGRRWGLVGLLYPVLIYIGVIYEGEHYAIDVLAGIIYAAGAYIATPHLIRAVRPWLLKAKEYSSNTRIASRSAR